MGLIPIQVSCPFVFFVGNSSASFQIKTALLFNYEITNFL
jgi:hypothetical protein